MCRQTRRGVASPGRGQLGGALQGGQPHPGGVRQHSKHEAVGPGHSGETSMIMYLSSDCHQGDRKLGVGDQIIVILQ